VQQIVFQNHQQIFATCFCKPSQGLPALGLATGRWDGNPFTLARRLL